MSVSLRCVVLFDIDGTLVAGPRNGTSAGAVAMDRASREVAGQKSRFTGADYAGRTDPQIARMLLEDAGVDHPARETVDALVDAYVRALEAAIERHPYRVLGAPRAAVDALRAAGALVGLGTGNVRAGGFLKLRSVGIDDLFNPAEGGFGDDGETRAEVLAAGSRTLDPEESRPVVIVGDTVLDVRAASAIGALSVAIPFRQRHREALVEAGASVIADAVDDRLVTVISSLLHP